MSVLENYHPANVKEAAEYIMMLLNNKNIGSRISPVPKSYGTHRGAWIQTLDPEHRYIYVKYESATSYKTIGREVEELKGHEGKTVNDDIIKLIEKYQPDIAFCDSESINCIDFETFMDRSYQFQQIANDEYVRGISKSLLKPVKLFFHIKTRGDGESLDDFYGKRD